MSRLAPIEMPLERVRRLALARQGLSGRVRQADKAALLDAVRRIGLVQIDSASVVERSHYLALFSRLGSYNKSDFDALIYPEGKIVEVWAHCASLVPVEDFGPLAGAMPMRREEEISKRLAAALGNDPRRALDRIYEKIARDGQCTSADFDDDTPAFGDWWNRRPARRALAHLAYEGRLVVARREGFRCVYDLTERVVPARHRRAPADAARFYRWVVARALGAMGPATAPQVADYYRISIAATREALTTLAHQGRIVPVRVEGWKEVAYAESKDRAACAKDDDGLLRTTFLSPFDSLVWHRGRTHDIFGFALKNEMYTPVRERERVHGYFVMPILHGGALIGRLDPKADRRRGVLTLRNLSLEPGITVDEALVIGIGVAALDLMRFAGCAEIRLEAARHRRLADCLQSFWRHPLRPEADPRDCWKRRSD